MTTNVNSQYVSNDNIIGAKKLKDNPKGSSNEVSITAPDSLPVFSLSKTLKERDLKTDMYRAAVVIPKKKQHTFRNLAIISSLIYFIVPRINFRKIKK